MTTERVTGWPGIELADPEWGPLDDIVDTTRWGLTDASAWSDLGRELARALDADGVATLTSFLRPGSVDSIRAELVAALPFVPVVHDRRSVYARAVVPADHPAACTESEWVAGHVTRDMIPAHSPAHRLYVSPRFKRLIAAAVGVDRVYEYADPLAGLVATVLPPGGSYGWHYDTNEYVVTISIQDADDGGDFEFHRDLRRPGDENLDGLADVLVGRAGSGTIARARPGDLQIFRGRYSLHRVTNVGGAAHRLTLVLSYAERPGLIGPVDRTRRVYGRVTEAHLVAEQLATGDDGLIW